jgi:hypothetical protein
LKSPQNYLIMLRIAGKCTPSLICYWLICLLLVNKSALAAGDSVCLVRLITIEGNKKTKKGIIERELGFATGDTIYISAVKELMANAQQQLINTSLFLEANVSYQVVSPGYLDFFIRVKERWYLFPVPVFSLADNNFNIWWRQQMRSLKRVNIGLALTHENVTGHNDELDIGFQTGFSNGIGIFYQRPNIGADKRHGAGIAAFFNNRREVIYASQSNRRAIVRLNDIIVRNKEVTVYYTYRKKINTQHTLSIRYADMRVADTVSKLNPYFFGLGRNRLRYLEAAYKMRHIRADNWQYPLRGYAVITELAKIGLGNWNDINVLRINVKAGKYIPMGKKWYADVSLAGNCAFSPNLPFIKQQALGYSDNRLLRGLDFYVLNGQAYLLSKNNIKKKVVETNIHLKFLPGQFEKIPVRVFLKTFGDAGYVLDKKQGSERLINRWLFTGGIGADLVTYYDASFSFEYGWNGWGQSGFFIRMNIGLLQ